MKIVQNKVTDYLSINVTEDETLWSSGAFYNYRDEVRVGHYIYKYAGEDGTNTTENPEYIWERDKNVFSVWVRIGATNYWAALDDKTLTQTENEDSLIIEISNDRYDSLCLLNVLASQITVELIDLTTSEIYQTFEVELIDRRERVDAYTHYFLPISLKDKFFTNKIYLIGNTKIKITINNTGGIAKLGRLIAGQSFYVGKTVYPAILDQVTYSRFDTDIFGNTNLEQGNTVKLHTYEVVVPLSKIESLEIKRQQLTAIPLLFIGDESDDSKVGNLLVYGYFTSAPFTLVNPSKSTINVNIKGLI